MQCAACRAVYSNALDACPRCHKPASTSAPDSEKAAARTTTRAENRASASAPASSPAATSETATATATQAPPASLIEFPGTARSAPRPQWRKDLSERVREIQQRRAREAALEQEAAAQQAVHFDNFQTGEIEPAEENPAPPLGLVPPRTDAPPLNPLVVAALRRIERARQAAPPAASTSKSRPSSPNGAATAAAIAYAPEENYRPAADTQPLVAPPMPAQPAGRTAPVAEAKPAPEASRAETSTQKSEPSSTEAARTSGLVVIPPKQPAKAEPVAGVSKSETPPVASASVETTSKIETKIETPTTPAPHASAPAPSTSPASATTGSLKPQRLVPNPVGDVLTQRREMEITDAANSVRVVETHSYNDRAPLAGRVFASIADLIIVASISAPFAAIIELTSGHWTDARVMASMGGIFVVVMFLYLVVSTGLIGRTLGMRLFSLRAVDARSALVPTTGQSTRRALFYMLSLATCGLGILYALFDAERRTAHDHLSGTIVVHE